MPVFRARLVSVFVALVPLLLVGCEARVTQENYDLITVGMAQHEVEAILGEGERQDVVGTGVSSSGLLSRDSDQSTRATYLWEEDGAQIIVDFEDQKVRSKRKIGF